MKRLILALLSFATTATALAQSYVPRDGEVKFTMLQTTESQAIHQVCSTPFTKHYYSLYETIDLDAAKPMHDYLGIGVSMTDASCWLLSQIDNDSLHAFFKQVFTKDGYNLSIVRLNCGSSDYATELYNYNDNKGDVEMKNFSVARDEKYMIPIIKSLKRYCPHLYTFSSIWSAPGWMKDSGEMCGGSLLNEHLASFTNYWAAYIKAYKERGIDIDAITIQNEPLTDQRGGCPATRISAEQEALLASKYIPQAFKKVGVDTKIWIHDHNYNAYERVIELVKNKQVTRAIDAIAWHPYDGNTPEVMHEIRKYAPNIDMHLTERGPNLTKLDQQDVKWWAETVFGALNNGCRSYSSWNLVLDADGQPNVGKHPCGGLFTIDIEKETFTESIQAKLFRQFSPYVNRGAKVLSIAEQKHLRSIAFQNPNGDYVVCVVANNIPNKRQTFQIKCRGEYKVVSLPLNTWSMTTIVIENDKK